MAIQNRFIPNKHYQKYNLKKNIADDGCRSCDYSSETIKHITGSRPILAGNEYIGRYDNVAKILYEHFASSHGVVDNILLLQVPT